MMPGHAGDFPHHTTRMQTAIDIPVRCATDSSAIPPELKHALWRAVEQERAGLEADVAAAPAETEAEARENEEGEEEEEESGADSKDSFEQAEHAEREGCVSQRGQAARGSSSYADSSTYKT